jgi:hypothetical protein
VPTVADLRNTPVAADAATSALPIPVGDDRVAFEQDVLG